MSDSNIQAQIDIIYNIINKYNNALDRAYSEELKTEIKIKLEKEEKNLMVFKDRYTEYFI